VVRFFNTRKKVSVSKSTGARILLYDIETAPNLSYTWGVYEQDVIEVLRPWYMLCFAYKWFDEPTTHVVALPDFKSAYKKDSTNDYHLTAKLHELFNEADIIIAHNGNKFDQKKVRAKFLEHGFDPPTYYRQIDTLQVARQNFKFDSNRLNDLGRHLNLGQKVQTGGWALWKECMAGDEKAWSKMKRYNKQDVVLLEQLYMRLRPWITNHPNVSVLNNELSGCPRCGSCNLQKRGIRHNKTTSYQVYQCLACRGYCNSRTAEKGEKPKFVN